METAVEMRGVSKYFPGIKANDSIQFSVDYGMVHALIGENGAGKTTLMRILYGMYQPDEGEILIDGKPEHYSVKGALQMGIAMVHQNFMQIPGMSVLENIILGHAPKKNAGVIDYKRARKEIMQLMRSLGMTLNPDTIIQRLSVGERQKIEILKALYLGARILILDEPTAVLTPQEASELFRIIRSLRNEGKAIIYISHKLNEVISIADCATVMRKGQVVGNFTSMKQVSERELAAAMIGKSDFSLIVGNHLPCKSDPVLKVTDLWYLDLKLGKATIQNLNFEVKRGEILGIGGVEGNGQQELISLLLGTQTANSGRINLDETDITNFTTHRRRETGLGYISADRMTTGLSLNSTVAENIICGKETTSSYSRWGFLKNKEISSVADQLIQQFDIRGAKCRLPARALSGGNLQKIVLAREISRGPKLLIAAHPTRGLDIGAINFVREQLIRQKESGAAILLITADLEELMAISDRILILYEGHFSGEIQDVASATEESIGLYMGGAGQLLKEEGDTI
ncbi:ABC transporter ATP-binding protein [Diplocloster modestus]|uniref:ABC transporter ATP-binding protein n=1 Tax=Diplocloster modestus TaxID=2850322 RepID=A0ABS6K9K5_9FIRM|nr:ABC transporter ATP-binding protein [Diplocloster modestus]MBU9727205.1 ABC transporter ATP-binding protein [Diplocloster modestus]